MTAAPLLLALCAAVPGTGASALEADPVTSFVKSGRMNVRRSEGRQVTEFSGDVRYRRDSRSLDSDWGLFDQGAELVQARGKILAAERLKSGERVEARGERGEHDLRRKRGRLDPVRGGRVELSRERADGASDAASAESLRWDLSAGWADLEGGFSARSPEGSALADRGRYLIQADALELEGGRPVVTARRPGWSAAAQGDRITATRPQALVVGQGRARGWVLFERGLPGTGR